MRYPLGDNTNVAVAIDQSQSTKEKVSYIARKLERSTLPHQAPCPKGKPSSCQDENIAYLEAKLRGVHIENGCLKKKPDAGNSHGVQRNETIACLQAKLNAAERDHADLKTISSARQDMIFTLTTKLEQSELEKEESRDQLLNVKSENRLYEWDITTLKRELAISSSSRASYQIALEDNIELVLKLKKEQEALRQQLSTAKAEAARTSSVWERLTCV